MQYIEGDTARIEVLNLADSIIGPITTGTPVTVKAFRADDSEHYSGLAAYDPTSESWWVEFDMPTEIGPRGTIERMVIQTIAEYGNDPNVKTRTMETVVDVVARSGGG